MKKVKSLNLDLEIIDWLQKSVNASEKANDILMRQYEREKGLPSPARSNLPRYSPRNSFAYVEERLKMLRSSPRAYFCELMQQEQGLSIKKTGQFINILINLNLACVEIRNSKEDIVSLWSDKDMRYYTPEEWREIKQTPQEKEAEKQEEAAILDAEVLQPTETEEI